MRSALFALGLSTILVGCAQPYGEEPASASEASSEAAPSKATSVKSKEAPTQPVEIAASPVGAGDEVPPAPEPSGPKVVFTWNKASETASYSFDVFLKDGTWIGPCISVQYIGKDLTTTFDGACPSSMKYPTVALADVDDFMLCSAEDNDWQHPTCTHAYWDGESMSVSFDN